MKIETELNIEKLDSGFIITKNNKQKLAIGSTESLEAMTSKILNEEANVLQHAYFVPKKNLKIVITVEFEL